MYRTICVDVVTPSKNSVYSKSHYMETANVIERVLMQEGMGTWPDDDYVSESSAILRAVELLSGVDPLVKDCLFLHIVPIDPVETKNFNPHRVL